MWKVRQRVPGAEVDVYMGTVGGRHKGGHRWPIQSKGTGKELVEMRLGPNGS